MDADVKKRVLQVCQYENVEYVDEGIDAVVNTAQGDMRQVSTHLSHISLGKLDGYAFKQPKFSFIV